jgi:MFS family permease
VVTEESRPRLVTPQFALVTTAGALYFLSLGLVLPVIPLYVEGPLGGDDLSIGVAVGMFAVGAVVLRPFAGRLGDRFGRRILVVAGAAVVSVSALLYLLASSLPLLVGARVVGGLGEAAFFVGAGTMIADLAPEARRGEAISYWSVAVYLGLAFGPPIGEEVLAVADYDTVWVVAAILAACASAVALLTRETLEPEARAAATARDEKLPLLHRRAVLPGTILFLGLCGLAGFTELVPGYARAVGLDDSGAVFLLYGLLILVVRVVGARLTDSLGPLRAGSWALVVGASGLVVIASFGTQAGLFAGTAVFAAGMCFMYPSMMTLALMGVDDAERASVVGTVSTFFDLSQGVGALILGGAAALSSDRGAFLVAALLALGGLVLLWSGADRRIRAAPAVARAYDELPEPEPGA